MWRLAVTALTGHHRSDRALSGACIRVRVTGLAGQPPRPVDDVEPSDVSAGVCDVPVRATGHRATGRLTALSTFTKE